MAFNTRAALYSTPFWVAEGYLLDAYFYHQPAKHLSNLISAAIVAVITGFWL